MSSILWGKEVGDDHKLMMTKWMMMKWKKKMKWMKMKKMKKMLKVKKKKKKN